MTDATDKAREALLKRYGGEEGLKKHYQDMQRKSRTHPNNIKGQHRGGFSDTEFAKKASKLGVEARSAKKVTESES